MSGLRVLIVEDGVHYGDLIRRTLCTLERVCGRVEVTATNTFASAARIVADKVPQDIVVLDLTLSDSTMEQTLARLAEIEGNAPTVIVTGTPRTLVERYLGLPSVPVVEKGPELFTKGYLTGIVVNAITAWHRRRSLPLREHLRVLEAFSESEVDER